LSRIPNIYNKPGNLLSLKQQVHRMDQMGFGHSFGTVEKAGASQEAIRVACRSLCGILILKDRSNARSRLDCCLIGRAITQHWP
jgi:hypothetical protein